MNQTQLQQEPVIALPRIEPSPILETADVAASLEAGEGVSVQSAVVEKLLAVMEQNMRVQEKWNTISSELAIIFVLIFAALKISEWTTGYVVPYSGNIFWIYAISAGACGIGALQLNKKVAAELTKLDDVRCVGALVEIWNPQVQVKYKRNTRRQAETALIRLLPRLKASDAPLLKEYQRFVLRQVLDTDGYKNWGRYYDEAFLLAIIEAFAQIGDWKSFPQVRRLTITAKYASVQKAARECLPFLEDLARKQTAGVTLLRAFSATDAASTAPETLLRPATPTTDARPETLLRPAE